MLQMGHKGLSAGINSIGGLIVHLLVLPRQKRSDVLVDFGTPGLRPQLFLLITRVLYNKVGHSPGVVAQPFIIQQRVRKLEAETHLSGTHDEGIFIRVLV